MGRARMTWSAPTSRRALAQPAAAVLPLAVNNGKLSLGRGAANCSPSGRPPLSESLSLAKLMEAGAGRGRVVATRTWRLQLDDFASATSLGPALPRLEGRAVAVAVGDMAKAAAALIELDGLARRIVLCPPELDARGLAAMIGDAEADALVYDGDAAPPEATVEILAPCRLPLEPRSRPPVQGLATEWVMPTSGTSGPPKMVVHTLATLTGAFRPAASQAWATFYDIRRYGGLQIFLRGLAGTESLTLSGAGESVEAFLVRLGEAGATHISGTPSHWRIVLMSGQQRRIDPKTVRLSGEIADDSVLAALRALYPRARVEHAFASTEAGVAFVVDDGRAGFPASLLEAGGEVALKIVDGSLRVRSNRTALRYVGPHAPALRDDEDFIDTGDMVERRGDRFVFAGRRAESSTSAARRFTPKRSRRRSTPMRRCAPAAPTGARVRSPAQWSPSRWRCATASPQTVN